MSAKRFDQFVTALTPGINAAIADLLPLEEGPAAALHQAMRYSVLTGGKRLRPALCIASFTIIGDNMKLVLPVACALEMVHAFTLVHDDMPCMDNDDLRRGAPTTHKVFGEATALLAGDALHNLAYQVLARHCADKLEPHTGSIIIQTFSKAVGKVCAGQMADLNAENKEADADLLRYIHENKTAALIWASIICGAVCADAPAHLLAALSEFSDAVGLLFQNVDDILDVYGDTGVTGKTGPSDDRHKKMTTISTLGIEAAVDLATKQRNLALQSLSAEDNCEILSSFAEYVYERIPKELR